MISVALFAASGILLVSRDSTGEQIESVTAPYPTIPPKEVRDAMFEATGEDLAAQGLEVVVIPDQFTVQPTPVPTPGVAEIGGLVIPLPEGMRFREMMPFGPPYGPRTRNWAFLYNDEAGLSRLSVDEHGALLLSDIRPPHSDLFQPIILALVGVAAE
jgi:hypothetical protein